MWKKSYSQVYQNVNKATIWNLWSDVNRWTTWHGDLDSCTMEGPFAVGNHFFLQPKGSRPVKIFLTEITAGHSFTDCTAFPGAKMHDTHILEETPEGLKITSTLEVKGILSWLWVRLVAQNVAASAPREMDSVVALARSMDAR